MSIFLTNGKIIKNRFEALIPTILEIEPADQSVYVVNDRRFAPLSAQVWTEKDRQRMIGVRAQETADLRGGGTFEQEYDRLNDAFNSSQEIFAVTPEMMSGVGIHIEIFYSTEFLEAPAYRKYDKPAFAADLHKRIEEAMRYAFPDAEVDYHFLRHGENEVRAVNIFDCDTLENVMVESRVRVIIQKVFDQSQFTDFRL